MPKTAVAIPVKDEEERIGDCVDAFLAQSVPADAVVFLLNNCSDDTAGEIARHAAGDPRILVRQHTLTGDRANVGEARRLALDDAAYLAGPDGIVLTTDADATVPPDWVADNLRAIGEGAEVVCGKAAIHASEIFFVPERMHEDHLEECAFADLLDEITWLVDPDPADPPPRHQQHSGASIAMTVAAYRRAGGAARVPSGEDRALIEKLRRVDAVIRHADITVSVSGRLEGRAPGGMAETMKRRLVKRDERADDHVEPVVDAYRRVLAKAAARTAWRGEADPADLAADLLVDPAALRAAIAQPYFGAAWEAVQSLSPVLRRRTVLVKDLPRETRQARELRDQLLQATESPSSLTGPELAG